MDTGINFFELKTQLADLGFTETGLVDQLREAMFSEYSYAALYTDRETVRFQINLEKDHTGLFSLETYDAILTSGNKLRNQVFGPDAPVVEAIALLQNRLQHPDVSTIIAGTPMNRQEVKQFLNQKTMNTQNLSYLQKQLLNLGFGEKMNADLEKNIQAKTPEFTLGTTQEYNQQKADYTLHFKRGDENEMYFFNKYDAATKDLKQTFYMNKGNGITAKEAFNLMEGRAVHKQMESKAGEKYQAWLVLNKAEGKIDTYGEKWNYKPERGLDKLDIVGINDEGAREKLMKSLEKGNRHDLKVMQDGKEVKISIEANPADHKINIYNAKGISQKLETYKKPEAKQEQNQQQKEGLPAEKKSRRQGAKQHV